SGNILSSLNKLEGELRVLPTGENRDLITSNLKGAVSTLENFVLKITSESKSFGQFQGANGGLGGRVLSTLSLASNTPLKQLEEEVKKNITLNKQSNTVQEKLNKAT